MAQRITKAAMARNTAATRKRGPYQIGDMVKILHSCGNHGTELSHLPVQRIVALSDGRSWRIGTTRCDGTALEVVVNSSGKDVHGYVERA